MIKAVILDWDGTVVDSNFLYILAFERVLKDKKVRYNKRELLSMFGIPTKKIIEYLLLKNNLSPALAEEMTKIFYVYIKEEVEKGIDKIKLKEGAKEFLSMCKQHGMKVYILTGNEEQVVERMAKGLEVNEFTDKVYGFSTLKHPKPSPLVIEQILSENNLDKQDVVLIGDTDIDRETANNAGIRFIGIESEIPLTASTKFKTFFPIINLLFNKEKKIILITGLAGAGKTTIRDILTSLLHLPYVRFGSITDDIIKKRGLKSNEETNKKIRDEIRAKYGMGGYALLSLPKIEKALEQNRGVIIDGVYSWEEVEILKNHFSSTQTNQKIKIISLAVVADKELRYKRLEKRKGRRWSREEAIKRDEHEVIEINKGTTISMADYFICNNGDKKELEERVKKIIKEILIPRSIS